MKIINTSEARKNLGLYLDSFINRAEHIFVFGRRNIPEGILIKFPDIYNPKLSEINNINAYSTSFNFLDGEPELYNTDDAVSVYKTGSDK